MCVAITKTSQYHNGFFLKQAQTWLNMVSGKNMYFPQLLPETSIKVTTGVLFTFQ